MYVNTRKHLYTITKLSCDTGPALLHQFGFIAVYIYCINDFYNTLNDEYKQRFFLQTNMKIHEKSIFKSIFDGN